MRTREETIDDLEKEMNRSPHLAQQLILAKILKILLDIRDIVSK